MADALTIADRYRVTAITTRRINHTDYWSALQPSLVSQRLRVEEIGRSLMGRPLRAILGDASVVEEPSGDVTVTTADGPRTITLRPYADTGHMITMFAAGPFADDTRAFLEAAEGE